MNAEQLLQHYERIADAPEAVPRLRRFILDLAVRGKLVPQDPNEVEFVLELLRLIERSRPPAKRIEVPLTWLQARVGTLLDFQYGKAKPARERLDEAPVPVFGSNGIVGYCLEPLTTSPAIIVGRKGSAGAINVCDGPSWTTDVAYFVIAPMFFDLRFLKIALLTLSLDTLGKGVKPGLSRIDAYELILAVPPLAEQHRIVAKVDELMALCDRLEVARQNREATRDRFAASTLARLNQPDPDPHIFRDHAAFALKTFAPLTTRPDQIKALRQTILNLAVRGRLVPQDPNDEPASELLKRIAAEKARLVRASDARNVKATDTAKPGTPLFDLMNGWHAAQMREILLELQTGPFGSSLHQSDYEVGGTPVVNPAAIQSERLVPVEKMAVGPATLERLSTFKLRAGDIVMGRRGEMERCAAVTENEDGWVCGTGCLILRLPRCVYAPFVVLLIGSPYVREYLGGSAVGATMQNLNQNILLNLTVALPPLAEQHRIVAKVDELMALYGRLEASLTETDTSRLRLLDAILHAALAPSTNSELQEPSRVVAHG